MKNKLLILVGIIIFIFSVSVSSYDPLHCYEFTTDGTDTGSNPKHFTFVNGPTIGEGKIGNGLGFADANSSYIFNASYDDLGSVSTLDFWWKPLILDATDYVYYFFNSSNAYTTQRVSGTSFNQIITSVTEVYAAPIAAGTWYHIVQVFNATDYKFYVNGELNQTDSSSAALLDIWYEVTFGRRGGGSPLGYVTAIVDEIGMYDEQYSEADVTASYAGGIGVSCGAELGPPTILQINFTTDGGAVCSGLTECSVTDSLTNVFTLTLDGVANGTRISLVDEGYDSMPTDCTGNGTDTFVCIWPTNVSIGSTIYYFASINADGNHTAPLDLVNKANVTSVKKATGTAYNHVGVPLANVSIFFRRYETNFILFNLTTNDTGGFLSQNISFCQNYSVSGSDDFNFSSNGRQKRSEVC